ncbi:hypothetical protein HYH02_010818 [Chlamydomonas schloesseri]|uniref:Ionotropic glutamate receptor C-terminal domain-containing protein n=1 Tax=Chlamydomonas schloesseri TaxID=2026947 RepID=A0A835T8K7_9CHLO|nr:hypothetical protein HYH02_010818 [Chlamydomonas schloesseri]|eukprot:KAG2438363.1 hypothetical protein HYH02_010818 [Chlamydomonas schloesseri]
MLIELLNKIISTAEQSITYTLYTSPTNAGGTLGANGVWSGVVGELVYGRADVVLFPLTRTASRLSAIDCTFSYLDQGLSLLIRDEQRGPGPLSVLEPFKMTLWLTLLCTVVGVALLFWLLDLYSKWIRTRQTRALRRTGALTGRAAARAKQDEDSHVFISFMAAAGAPERPRRSSWGVQVLYLAYCFFCLIVLSSYTANLTSFLAVRRAELGIQGLQDLVRDNGLLGVNPNGSTAAYFASSQDTLATQLQPRVRYCATDTCVAWLRAGEVAAFVSDQPLLDYIAEQQPCDLQVVGDPFGPGNLVVGLQKGSPWLPLFNNAIQRFSEDGTLSTLYRTWFDGLSQCDDGSAAVLESSRLGVDQMLGAFVFLLFGALAAFIISNCENLKWCLVRAYSNPSTMSRMSSAGAMRSSWHRISSNLLGVNELLEEAGVAPPWPPAGPAQQPQQGLGAAEPEGWGQSPAKHSGAGAGGFDPSGCNGTVTHAMDANATAAQERTGDQHGEGPPGGPGGMWPRPASGRVLPGGTPAAAASLVGLVSRKSGFTHSPRLREYSDFGAEVVENDDATEAAAQWQHEGAGTDQATIPVAGAAAVVAAAAAASAGGGGGGGADGAGMFRGQPPQQQQGAAVDSSSRRQAAQDARGGGSVELGALAPAAQLDARGCSTEGERGCSTSSRDGCSSEGELYHRASSYLLQPAGTTDSCTLLLPREARSSDGRGAIVGTVSLPAAVAASAAAAGARYAGGSSWRRNPLATSAVAASARDAAFGTGIAEEGGSSSRGSSTCSGAFVSGSALDATGGTSGQESSGEVWGGSTAAAGRRGGGGSSSHVGAGAGVGAYRPPSLVQTMSYAPAAAGITVRAGSPLGPHGRDLHSPPPPPPIQLQLVAALQPAPAAGSGGYPQLPAPQPQPQPQPRAAASSMGAAGLLGGASSSGLGGHGGGGGGGGGRVGSPQQQPQPQPQQQQPQPPPARAPHRLGTEGHPAAVASGEGGLVRPSSAPYLPVLLPAAAAAAVPTAAAAAAAAAVPTAAPHALQQPAIPPRYARRPPGSAGASMYGLGATAAISGVRALGTPTGRTVRGPAGESPAPSTPGAWALTSGIGGGGSSNPDTAMASFVTAPDASMSTLNYSGPMLNIAIASLNTPAPAAPAPAAAGLAAAGQSAAAAVGAPSPRQVPDDEEALGGENVMSFLYHPPIAPLHWSPSR